MRIDSDIIKHEVSVMWDSTALDPDGTYGVSNVVDNMATVPRMLVTTDDLSLLV